MTERRNPRSYTDEFKQQELVELHKRLKQLEMENDILHQGRATPNRQR